MNSPFTPYQEALGATLIDRSFREKIVLVAVALPGVDEAAVDASLDELELLVDTAGADVVARVVQRRDKPDHTWYIGKGKAEELKQIGVAVDADTVVFDNELAPAQQFNLEKLLGRTAIDRTAVILDIFAQNAHTLEGKAQVELALLRYRLPDAGVLVEDRLFATLDPTTRRLSLPGGEPVLLTDTVGFVRNLPHGLIEAFKGTLEVAARADYLVHVVDSGAPDPEGQIAAVRAVLDEIEAGSVPELLVFNKSDLAPEEAKQLAFDHPGSVAVSALTGEGIDDFLATLGDRLRALTRIVELTIPYERGDVLASVHREGEVVTTTESDDGFVVTARLSEASLGRLADYVTAGRNAATL